MNKQKIRQHGHRKGKRNRQNIRTYQRITEKRTAFAKRMGITLQQLMEKLGMKRWNETPKAR